MPNMNKTGPNGTGPNGRGLGNCENKQPRSGFFGNGCGFGSRRGSFCDVMTNDKDVIEAKIKLHQAKITALQNHLNNISSKAN